MRQPTGRAGNRYTNGYWADLPIGLALLLSMSISPALGQERWFQIEVSVFSNESAVDRNEELWLAEGLQLDYPARLRRLDTLLERLLIPAFRQAAEPPSPPLETPPDPAAGRRALLQATGPFPPQPGDRYNFIDFARDAFAQLPMSESDFRQTNSTLERNPAHRLLFHGLWRQPMPDAGDGTAVAVSGGNRYGEHWELEGSLNFYYNNARDRIVIDADIWLSEFSVNPDPQQEWTLPPLPDALRGAFTRPDTANAQPAYYPVTLYHLAQQRQMRSTEFHYLDHPALGLVVTVTPYEVPPLPETGPEPEITQTSIENQARR